MAGIDNLAAVMGRDADMDHVERDRLCDEAAAEITRLRAALADVKERCAKVADPDNCLDPQDAEAVAAWNEASRIAASIRALE